MQNKMSWTKQRKLLIVLWKMALKRSLKLSTKSYPKLSPLIQHHYHLYPRLLHLAHLSDDYKLSAISMNSMIAGYANNVDPDVKLVLIVLNNVLSAMTITQRLGGNASTRKMSLFTWNYQQVVHNWKRIFPIWGNSLSKCYLEAQAEMNLTQAPNF